MATTVGSLLIDLRADVASLRTDLAKANAVLAQQSAQMNRSLNGLTAGFAAVGQAARALVGAVAVGALLRFGKASLDAADNLGELAEQLGVSTDALQVYQYAAVQAGVSAEQLEAGLSQLTRRIGEAASGTKEQAEAFRTLGVRILDAGGKTRSTEAIFADVADAIAAIDDPARRAQVAVDLFGRSGQRLLPILSQGRAGLAAFEEQARRVGAVLTEEQIKTAGDAADAIAAMTLQWNRFAQALVSNVGPAITGVIALLNQATLGPSRAQQLDSLRGQLLRVTNGDELRRLQALQQGLGSTGTAIQRDAARRQIEGLPGQAAALRAQIARLENEIDRGEGVRPPATTPEQTSGNRFATARPSGGEQRSALDERLAALRIQQENEYADALERQRTLLDPVRALQAAYNNEMRALDEALNSTNENLRITAQEYENLAGAARGRLAEGIAEIKKETRETSEAANAFGQIMESAFEDALIAGKSFRDVLQGILGDLAKVVLRQSVTNPLGNAVSSLAGSLGNSFLGLFGSSGGAKSITASQLSAISPSGNYIPQFAAGGRPPRGRVSLVGEEGPELFVPDVAGSIIPNGEWGGGGGGGATVISIDARHSRLSAAEMRAIVTSAVNESRAAVVDDARRGGARSAALRGR
jgi:hypothetical protein